MRLRSERLPFVEDAPPPAAATAAQPKRAGSMWPWYLLLTLLVAAVAVGAWWLSTGKEAAPPMLPAEESFPIPVIEPAPPGPEPLVEEPPANSSGTVAGAPRPIRTEVPAPIMTDQRSTDGRRPSVRDSARNHRGIVPADEPTTGASPVTGPTPIVLYHPQPNRGRVVQLGAFPTRAQAEASWKRITRRYPYLATKAKLVNTVDVRGLGGGRPTRMHRLQLGTSSQAQSVVICQQLERAGYSCVVVY